MLIDRITSYKNGNKEILVEIINKFNPILKKYSYEFLYFDEDTYSELVILLIELLNKMNIDNFKFDGEVISYLSKTIKNGYIDIVRKESKSIEPIFLDDMELTLKSVDQYEILFGNLNYDKIIEKLSEREKYVTNELFKNGKTEVEVARALNVSKQYINKTKKSVLHKLKCELERMRLWN